MFALLLLVSVLGMTFWGFLSVVDRIEILDSLFDPYLRHVVWFTIKQATLSTFLSLVMAIPVMQALSRHSSFPGRRLLLQLSSLSFVMPTMVAVLGIVSIYGYNGYLNRILSLFGFNGGIDDGYYLYGLTGILIAHLFFNLPLAVRVYLQAVSNLPRETWNLAVSLGMSEWQIFRFIEWPLLRSIMPGLGATIFLLCFTSFAIVLTLGGGPRATTLEVAIYQAIQFDFDLQRGANLSLLQIGLCCLIVIAISYLRRPFSFQMSASDRMVLCGRTYDSRSSVLIYDAFVLILFTVYLLSPFMAIIMSLSTSALMQVLSYRQFWQSLSWTVVIASVSGMITIMWALPIAALQKKMRFKSRYKSSYVIETLSLSILIVPPITLGVGLFLMLRNWTDIFSIGAYLVILINALLALPFAYRILVPSIESVAQRHDRLCESLGVNRIHRWRIVYLPQISASLSFAFAVSVTLSAGDMGVIALFGTQDLSTLPLLIYRLMSSYQMQQAAATAVLLCILCAIFFWGIDRGLRRYYA